MKICLLGWGFGIRRYFNGGAWKVPITWRWQIAFYWTWYHFWQKEKHGLWHYDRCFYPWKDHEPTEVEREKYMSNVRRAVTHPEEMLDVTRL